MIADFAHKVNAGFAGMYVVTSEETRLQTDILDEATRLHYHVCNWTASTGLHHVFDGQQAVHKDLTEQDPDPLSALSAAAVWMAKQPARQVLFVFNDLHVFLEGGQAVMLVRTLKELVAQARGCRAVFLLVGCRLCLPPELEREFSLLEYPLPRDFRPLITQMCEQNKLPTLPSDILQAVNEATLGLTYQEAEDVLALSMARHGRLVTDYIAAAKAQMVKKGGLLEITTPDENADSIGGLSQLREWLSRRRRAFTPEAVQFGLPTPKGILILGIPGTGKSLTAKATAAILGRPLLRLDPGRLFGGLVGESESNLRRALAMAEAVSPCVLFVDELEKALSGSQSGGRSDGGTSQRVFGTLLTWLQEKKAPVFVVATCNDISALPPELLRKGRFDELWFTDLPTPAERQDIWRIQLTKHGQTASEFDLAALATDSDGFTGAEIEQAVIDALYLAFDLQQKLTSKHVQTVLRDVFPLSVTMAVELDRLRSWARGRTRPASSSAAEAPVKPPTGRIITMLTPLSGQN